jgi:hypothetical protein
MSEKTISTGENPEIVIQSVGGDLRLAGWERSEVSLHADEDELKLTQEAGRLTLTCDSDLQLSVPYESRLTIELVEGDASLSDLRGPIELGRVGGDLNLQKVDQLKLEPGTASVSSEYFSDQITQQVERATRKAEAKVKAAMRRAERKMQQAGRHYGRRWHFDWNVPSTPQAEPVSDEERLTVLRMLQDKKITLEEAEELLGALG